MLHQTTEMHLLFCSLGFSFHLPPPKRLLAASFRLAFIFKGPSGLASPSLCPKLLRNCCYSALLSHFYFSRLHYNNFVPENLIVILNIYCMLHVNKCQVDSWNVTSFCKNFSLLSFLCLDLHRCCDETFYISSSDLKKEQMKRFKNNLVFHAGFIQSCIIARLRLMYHSKWLNYCSFIFLQLSIVWTFKAFKKLPLLMRICHKNQGLSIQVMLQTLLSKHYPHPEWNETSAFLRISRNFGTKPRRWNEAFATYFCELKC